MLLGTYMPFISFPYFTINIANNLLSFQCTNKGWNSNNCGGDTCCESVLMEEHRRCEHCNFTEPTPCSNERPKLCNEDKTISLPRENRFYLKVMQFKNCKSTNYDVQNMI